MSNSITPTTQTSSLLQQAHALHQAGNIAQAIPLYQQVIETTPDNIDALYLLGLAQVHNKNPHEAARLFASVILHQPQHQDALFNYAQIMEELGEIAESLAAYRHLFNLFPKHLKAAQRILNLLSMMGRKNETLPYYDHIIALAPDELEIQLQRANLLYELGRYSEAREQYEKYLFKMPQSVNGWINRGVTLRDLHEHKAALESFDRALSMNPNHPQALSHRGNSLRSLRRFEESFQSYYHAIAVWPDYADAHYNLAIGKILTGNYKEGWREYEWRWRSKELNMGHPPYPQPLWLGKTSLKNKTILIHAEQGLGDVIQFSRYIKLVAQTGAFVLFGISLPLKSIFKKLEGVDILLTPEDPTPQFDVHCPLLSLPLAFQTELETIPVEIPYLHTPPEKLNFWQNKIGPKSKPRVGLVWSGNPDNKNNPYRSIPFALLNFLSAPHIEFFSLQQEVLPEDKTALSQRTDIAHFGKELKDLSDTAALIELMDVVITVDTSVAHLAGALGKPVWILVHYYPDWRWLNERKDSPWYPSARIFRQTWMNNWKTPIEEVQQELLTLFPAQI